ncbi:hypothetical protein PPL_06353 [Heterostelium album PN500]|uniref:Uncharacterized protein n=1 Tax=Heterostelium pallidum (strain ATCC 26659 / Pp 5 / PN500) TaxID=670386 RepID=D3BCX5_HETP5|nr:hypothetical protein PPL_06353 [Heterostelium album PN500]EFA80767.1 hypothetical protein PPL_06353 [Heterostelium album PN500]|eukprot:XP_020432886.1 hypothetical protein PPL_06353 [Heterostelium album PN500]
MRNRNIGIPAASSSIDLDQSFYFKFNSGPTTTFQRLNQLIVFTNNNYPLLFVVLNISNNIHSYLLIKRSIIKEFVLVEKD